MKDQICKKTVFAAATFFIAAGMSVWQSAAEYRFAGVAVNGAVIAGIAVGALLYAGMCAGVLARSRTALLTVSVVTVISLLVKVPDLVQALLRYGRRGYSAVFLLDQAEPLFRLAAYVTVCFSVVAGMRRTEKETRLWILTLILCLVPFAVKAVGLLIGNGVQETGNIAVAAPVPTFLLYAANAAGLSVTAFLTENPRRLRDGKR